MKAIQTIRTVFWLILFIAVAGIALGFGADALGLIFEGTHISKILFVLTIGAVAIGIWETVREL